jgi:hypothetical protein
MAHSNRWWKSSGFVPERVIESEGEEVNAILDDCYDGGAEDTDKPAIDH